MQCKVWLLIHYVCIVQTKIGKRVPQKSRLIGEFSICTYCFNNYVNHSQRSGKNHHFKYFKYSIYKAICYTQRDRIDGQDMGNYCFINESQKNRLPLNNHTFPADS